MIIKINGKRYKWQLKNMDIRLFMILSIIGMLGAIAYLYGVLFMYIAVLG